MANFSEEFLFEFFKLMLKKTEILEAAIQHLKYSYIPNEELKEIFKTTLNYFRLQQKLPTLGLLSENFSGEKKIQQTLMKIKNADDIDQRDAIINIQEFIKKAKFIETYNDLSDAFNKGNIDNAYSMLIERGTEIIDFSIIKETRIYEEIFGNFEERNRVRFLETNKNEDVIDRMPLGIDELDFYMKGGLNITDTALFLGSSGFGKTKLLRWIGVSAARKGYKVLHIQAEGSKKSSLIGYDSTWTGITNEFVESGYYEDIVMSNLKKVITDIKSIGGEIFVHAFETFSSPNILEIKEIYKQVEKIHGQIDLIIVDYLELFQPSDYKRYSVDNERERRKALAREFKNLVTNLVTRGVTVAQANDVPPLLMNNPEFVLTRNNLAEFKNYHEPFSLFATINRTMAEKEQNICRIFIDKNRDGYDAKVVKIYQALETDRFYDRKKTLEAFYHE